MSIKLDFGIKNFNGGISKSGQINVSVLARHFEVFLKFEPR